jgi:hypothetical protein
MTDWSPRKRYADVEGSRAASRRLVHALIQQFRPADPTTADSEGIASMAVFKRPPFLIFDVASSGGDLAHLMSCRWRISRLASAQLSTECDVTESECQSSKRHDSRKRKRTRKAPTLRTRCRGAARVGKISVGRFVSDSVVGDPCVGAQGTKRGRCWSNLNITPKREAHRATLNTRHLRRTATCHYYPSCLSAGISQIANSVE